MAQFNRGGGFGGGRDNKRFGGGKRFSGGSRSFGGRDSERPAMHQAVCDECGQSCQVPFKPSGDKPVYCNQCFKGNDNGGNSRGFERRSFGERSFGGRDSERSTMHEAVCDECGETCEVPFKPSGDKAVYCSQCFKKDGKGNSGKNNDQLNQLKGQFDILNTKLDRILKAFDSMAAFKTSQGEAPKKKTEKVKPEPEIIVMPEPKSKPEAKPKTAPKPKAKAEKAKKVVKKAKK